MRIEEHAWVGGPSGQRRAAFAAVGAKRRAVEGPGRLQHVHPRRHAGCGATIEVDGPGIRARQQVIGVPPVEIGPTWARRPSSGCSGRQGHRQSAEEVSHSRLVRLQAAAYRAVVVLLFVVLLLSCTPPWTLIWAELSAEPPLRHSRQGGHGAYW